MTQWEYEVVCQDSLEAFQKTLNFGGSEGWEAISANYVIREAEESFGHRRPVWIAVLKREVIAG